MPETLSLEVEELVQKYDHRRRFNELQSRYQMLVLCLPLVMAMMIALATPQAGGQEVNAARNGAAPSAQMKPYSQKIDHAEVMIRMVPIPAGTFLMGSPLSESGRNPEERRRAVRIDAFWMSACEITWDAYEEWMLQLDIRRRKLAVRKSKRKPKVESKVEPRQIKVSQRDKLADAVTRPTRPFTDMTFGMGKQGYPAICMTQHAARTFCRWLSARTGQYYRLPTEAEWEYACRAGAATAYSFGDDAEKLSDYAWSYDNSDDQYHKVGLKKPNQWGLYDMHGNVAEWVLDQYRVDAYSTPFDKSSDQASDQATIKPANNPLVIPTKLYPRVVRGGSWDDDPSMLRCAARGKSDPSWKKQDPQFPKSIWYHTDALHVGFRIVRPLCEPSDQEKNEKWEKSLPLQIDQ